MRGMEWRRYKKEQKVISRIKMIASNSYHRTIDANGNFITDFKWMDFIGTYTHYMYKTYTTKDSKYKSKWGKGKGKWGYSDVNTRVSDKKLFKRMLENEYGIKSFNIEYGFIQNNTGE